MTTDAKLQEFLNGMTSLAKIRGLNSKTLTTVSVMVNQPGTNNRFEVIVASEEPSKKPVVINLLWVRVSADADGLFKPVDVVKLKDFDAPNKSGVTGAIRGLEQSWVHVTTYDAIFVDPPYTNVNGFQGPKGDKGDKGDKGEPGSSLGVDIGTLVDAVANRLKTKLVRIVIKGKDIVQSGTNATYTIEGIMGDGSIKNVPEADVQWSVVPDDKGSISDSGVFTANSFSSDKSASIRASYTFNGITRSDSFLIRIVAEELPVLTMTSIAISTTTPGLTTFAPGDTEQFIATATYSDGTTKVVQSDDTDLNGTLVWSVLNSGLGTITDLGMFTAGSPSINITNNVKVRYTPITGTAKQDLYSITVSAGATRTLQSISIIPATSTLASGGTVDLNVQGNYSSAPLTEEVTSGITWDLAGSGATIDPATGVVTADAVTADSTITVTATVGSLTDTQVITVTAPGTLETIDSITVVKTSGISITNLNVGESTTTGIKKLIGGIPSMVSAAEGTATWEVQNADGTLNATFDAYLDRTDPFAVVFTPLEVTTGNLIITATFTANTSMYTNSTPLVGSSINFDVVAAPVSAGIKYILLPDRLSVWNGSSSVPEALLESDIDANFNNFISIENNPVTGTWYMSAQTITGSLPTYNAGTRGPELVVAVPAEFTSIKVALNTSIASIPEDLTGARDLTNTSLYTTSNTHPEYKFVPIGFITNKANNNVCVKKLA